MGASLWDQLLIGVASSTLFAALCFVSVRLWNCLMQQIRTQTPVGERPHEQPLPETDAAAAHANGEPDSETGNGYGPAEGGEPMTERELESGIVKSGQGIGHFNDQDSHTPVTEPPVTTRKAQVTGDAARGALVRPVVEMDVPPNSQREEEAADQ